ncbi:kelch repeat-containing protein [Uliginosibacterium sp. H1]|uniref:kelch repeat-containing protein n=1 Tax=Uliginosibacterium sp. H1 TaxID=3114757 RepID=UPI002E1794F5|nr:kelch repeat-containing protein [Uliginosibacterium sp. H1]
MHRLRTSNRQHRSILAVLVLFFLSLFSTLSPATTSTGSTTVPRMMHSASTLADGKILLAGGYARPGTPPYASVERYDPATGVFTAVAPMLQARTEHAAVTLRDGRVMVFGGSIVTSPGLVGTASTEIWDPATNQWTAAANMHVVRARAMARLLPSGKVFVMNPDSYSTVRFAEIYDPATNTFTQTGSMIDVTGWHGLVVLQDGRVLKVGGYASNYLNRAEIWDPATNQWSATGSMGQPRQDVRPFLLSDGKVLVPGGRNTSSLSSTEIYDPATGQFLAGPAMPIATAVTSATVLDNGDVIVMGDYTRNLIRYQAASAQWNLTGPKRAAVRSSTASLLPGGDLLLVGGAELNDANSTAQIWAKACSPQVIALSGSNSQTLAASGGQVIFTLTAAPGCRFEIANVPAWLTASAVGPQTMPASGSLALTFTATTNSTGASRNVTLSLGNNAASITQPSSASCPAPTVSPPSLSVTAPATTSSLQVSVNAGCAWSLSGLPSWITPTSATSGSGNGTVTFQVAANAGSARNASLLVSSGGYGSSVQVSQAAAGTCTSVLMLNPTFLSFGAAATSSSIQVSAASTCTWSLSGLPSWVTATSATSGTGNGFVSFQVAANTGSARYATAQVSASGVTSTFNLNQAAAVVPPASCSTHITSGSYTGNLVAGCPAGARGSSYNTYRYTFNAAPGNLVSIQLSSSAFDTYVYLKNPSGTVIAANDDGGGGTNSRIPAGSGVFTLPAGSAGVYSIEVTSYYSGSTGAYSLTLGLTQ